MRSGDLQEAEYQGLTEVIHPESPKTQNHPDLTKLKFVKCQLFILTTLFLFNQLLSHCGYDISVPK